MDIISPYTIQIIVTTVTVQIIPVSYTHLDVYKRQTVDGRRLLPYVILNRKMLSEEQLPAGIVFSAL